MVKQVQLDEFIDRKRAKGAVEIVTGDGTVFTVDPPPLWPDSVAEHAARNDIVGIARALLGDRYDEFVAKGGSAAVLSAILEDHHGLTVGE